MPNTLRRETGEVYSRNWMEEGTISLWKEERSRERWEGRD